MAVLTIRDATAADEAGWRALWAGFLDYYEVSLGDEVIAFTWARLLDPASPLQARLAFMDGRMVGFAIHHHHPSTWVMGDDCYLEDLFVVDDVRGQGAGKALIDDLIALARARGWKRLYWHTDTANEGARALYDRYVRDDGHVRYRMAL